jgi:1,4-dihydroxy-2-naphthoate octaprenyltransferase
VGLYHLAPGIGELGVGIGFGPLAVLGAYYVQTQKLGAEAVWASIPVGLLIAAVLYINEFPDRRTDGAVGKRTLVVALGPERAVWGYAVLLGAAYVTVVTGVAMRALPATTLLSLITLPIAVRAVRTARRFHSDTSNLIPANAATIQIHLVSGLLLCLGYVIASFL